MQVVALPTPPDSVMSAGDSYFDAKTVAFPSIESRLVDAPPAYCLDTSSFMNNELASFKTRSDSNASSVDSELPLTPPDDALSSPTFHRKSIFQQPSPVPEVDPVFPGAASLGVPNAFWKDFMGYKVTPDHARQAADVIFALCPSPSAPTPKQSALLQHYIVTWTNYTPHPLCVLLVSVLYLESLREKHPSMSASGATQDTPLRCFFSTFVLASKYTSDHSYLNKSLFKHTPWSLREVNAIEREMVGYLDWSLWIDPRVVWARGEPLWHAEKQKKDPAFIKWESAQFPSQRKNLFLTESAHIRSLMFTIPLSLSSPSFPSAQHKPAPAKAQPLPAIRVSPVLEKSSKFAAVKRWASSTSVAGDLAYRKTSDH